MTFCVIQVMCREGYRSAAGVLQHLTDVKAPLDMACGMVGEGGLQVLDKLLDFEPHYFRELANANELFSSLVSFVIVLIFMCSFGL